jgi:hypothetical protein
VAQAKDRQAGTCSPPGRHDRIYLAGRKKIFCANGAELRDNDFNLGGLAIWDGTGRMDRQHRFEAEAIVAVSEPDYFSFRGFQIGPYTERP